jgi:hypothetical protein
MRMVAGGRSVGTFGSALWLVNPRYDLMFIIFSAALLLFPHAVNSIWPSNIVVDLVVTLLIGGPHLFATYTLTFMEPQFRERYRIYTRGAFVLPFLVLAMAIWHLDLLVTIFFFWASVHVIHQAAYIADSYRFKDARGFTQWGRIIDYGLLFSSLYAISAFKFTRTPLSIFGVDIADARFETGGRVLLFPDFLRLEPFAWLALAGFAFFFTAFLVNSVWEWREGRLNGPKTLHMTVAALLFFITPAFQNLDVAFQGLNTWHSFQYLAVVLYLNRLRAERGLIGSEFVRRTSRSGRSLYLLCLAFTVAAGVAYFVVRGVLLALGIWADDVMQQHYFSFYTVILSTLLIHYYFDHFLFLQIDDIITPRWTTANR